MKKILLPLFILCFTLVAAQTPCVNGMAGQYPCNGYDLQSYIPFTALGATDANDSWGWTDPDDGTEYALLCLNNGVAFLDISDPVNPVYLGKLPTHTQSSLWRDVKTYNNYAFIVSEASGHGMQVFDLTRLRNVTNPPVTFTEDAHYNGFGNAHNLVINESEGYAYGVGTNTFSGGPHFVNIQNPLSPVAAGGYSLGQYSHDGEVVTYNGPDTDYTGHEIFVGSNEVEVVIVDITDKSNPQGISTIGYTNTEYTHQGWFTEDQRYFILGDEIDEIVYGFNTRNIIFDFSDLDNPQLSFEYSGPTSATDHNGYVRGNTFYLANYKAGMRVVDISDIANGNMTETGFFDVFPSNNNSGYAGAWNVYPYFDSGNILISSLTYSDPNYIGGLFLVKSSAPDVTDPIAVCQNISASLDADGEVIIPAAQVDGGSSDDSGFFTLQISPNSFDCSDIGANNVVLTVTDGAGNTDTCTAVITIVDDIAPDVSCPSDYAVAYDTGASYFTLPDYVADEDVTAEDACLAPLSISQSPVSGTQLTDGVYTITFESTDSEGNVGSCSFELTVDQTLSNGDNVIKDLFKVYPNPVSNIITIISEKQKINSVQIFDMVGKKLFETSNINSNLKTLDVSEYAKGIYFMKVNENTSVKIMKL